MSFFLNAFFFLFARPKLPVVPVVLCLIRGSRGVWYKSWMSVAVLNLISENMIISFCVLPALSVVFVNKIEFKNRLTFY